MAYGFKLTGITIPENTTAINATISNGTITAECELVGSIAEGFNDTGISAEAKKVPTHKIINDENVTITNAAVEVSFPSGVDVSNAETWLVTIDNVELSFHRISSTNFNFMATNINGLDYYLMYASGTWKMRVSRNGVIPAQYVAGTYTLNVSDEFVYNLDIIVDELASENVGDEYVIMLASPAEPTIEFENAVKMVVDVEPITNTSAQNESQLRGLAFGNTVYSILSASRVGDYGDVFTCMDNSYIGTWITAIYRMNFTYSYVNIQGEGTINCWHSDNTIASMTDKLSAGFGTAVAVLYDNADPANTKRTFYSLDYQQHTPTAGVVFTRTTFDTSSYIIRVERLLIQDKTTADNTTIAVVTDFKISYVGGSDTELTPDT